MDEKDLDDDDVMDDDVEEIVRDEPKASAPPTPEGPGFVGRMWHYQHAINRKWDGMGKGRIARVLRMARKPEPEEFRQSAVIVLVGIAIIGGIGFFMYLLMSGLIHWIDTNLKGV
ncbi:MAG: protein translocase SEC61 complex subunit gamma [bacterium]